MSIFDTEKKDTSNEASKHEVEENPLTTSNEVVEYEIEQPPIKKTDSLSRSSKSKKASWGWRRFVKLWKKSPVKKLPTLKIVSKRITGSSRRNSLDIDKCPFNYAWKTFTYAQVKAATNNFSQGTYIMSHVKVTKMPSY